MLLELLVKLHPTVLFQITDAYERRVPGVPRIMGTLLGTEEKGIIEITNCYCLPFKNYKDQDNKIDPTFMYDLNQMAQGCKNERIVGWWITGLELDRHFCSINEIYSLICDDINPIQLTIDFNFEKSSRIEIKAYTRVINCKTGSMFAPVKVQIHYSDTEITGFRLCERTLEGLKTRHNKTKIEPLNDLEQISKACNKLCKLLDNVLTYVDDVLDGLQVPDNKVGRALLDMVNSVPKMTNDEFNEMFNSNAKDLLMVIALSKMIKTQIILNEKLTLLSM